MSTSLIADVEVMPAETPARPSPPDPGRTVVVIDPDLGPVKVRWRAPRGRREWAYRCEACDVRSDSPTCEHMFAAALHLAETVLGLVAVGVRTTESATTSHEENQSA